MNVNIFHNTHNKLVTLEINGVIVSSILENVGAALRLLAKEYKK